MQELRTGDKGEAVRAYQGNLNARLRAHRDTPIDADGEVGPITLEQSAYAAWFLGVMDSTADKVRAGTIPVGVQKLISDPTTRTDSSANGPAPAATSTSGTCASGPTRSPKGWRV